MNTSIDKVYAIIVAAGESKRVGKPKQLLGWQNRPLLKLAIDNARLLLGERVIVVLGAHAESIQSAINLAGVTVIVNPDWREGIASSIRTGVRNLPASAAAALILLCDQPLIAPAHIRKLLSGWQNEPACLVASQYKDSVGVPALFPAEFFGHLLKLEGNRGAKRVLLAYPQSLLKIPLPEAEIDIDTMGDFDRLKGQHSVEE